MLSRILLLSLFVAVLAQSPEAPLKTLADAAPTTTIRDGPSTWTNSVEMFKKNEEHSILSLIKSFVTDKVQSVLGKNNEAAAVPNVPQEQQGGQAAEASQSVAPAVAAFQQAFSNGLGDVVVVVEEKKEPAAAASNTNDAATGSVAAATTTKSIPADVAAHLSATAELEKERLDEEKNGAKIHFDSVFPDPNVAVGVTEDDDEYDHNEVEDLGEDTADALLDASPEVAGKMGEVLGHLFRDMAAAGDHPDSVNPANNGPAAGALQQQEGGVAAMHQWAKKQMDEMRELMNFKSDLNKRREALMMGRHGLPTTEESLFHDNGWERRWNNHPYYHQDQSGSRKEKKHRRHHRGNGRRHSGRRGGQQRAELAGVLQHLMMDDEIPNIGRIARVIHLPNGHVAVQVGVHE